MVTYAYMFPHYTAQNLLFAELLHRFVYIEDAPYILFPLSYPILFWLISKKFFPKFLAFIPTLILLLSPWAWYLSFGHSFYVFFFFLTLISIYGIILIQSGRIIFGNILVIPASLMAIYSSSIFLMLVPIALAILIVSKILSFKQLKITIVILAILASPLVFLIYKNKSGFLDSFNNEVKIFYDPSLLNSINRFQGAATQIELRSLSRIAENKYIFFTEYSLLKYSAQLVPETYFTPQYKLLGFSFSPPIFVGFIFPFIYGLYLALKKPDLRKIIFISTLLTIPSILANEQVAINRLILFSPTIFLLISYGLINLYKDRKNTAARNFLLLTLFLVAFQLIVTINDIQHREGPRFERYFGKKYELSEP